MNRDRHGARSDGCHAVTATAFAAAWALAVLLGPAVPAPAQEPPAAAQGPAPPAGAQAPEGARLSVPALEAAIAKTPDDPLLHVALGLAYWNGGDYPRALETFQRAVKVGPDSAEAHNWLGVALMEKADLPGAIASLRQAVTLDPKHGRAHTNLGAALVRSGDYAAATAVFEKALALEPNSLAAHTNLGMALREQGEYEPALTHLRRVVEGEPDNAGVHYELGQTLRQSGDLPGAIAAFERAIELNPEMREGYYALGLALRQQGAASRAAGPPPDSPADALVDEARASARQGDLNAARDRLSEALRLDASHADAHNLLGFVLGQQGDAAAALEHLERAVRLQPESAEVHYNLGAALWYSGSKEKAVSELRKSVRLDPAAGGSHALLGLALREQGDLAAARASLQRAIALLPPTAAVYVDLGITFLRSGGLDEALGQFIAGLNLPGPASPEPDWSGAVAALRDALPADADRADAHNVMGLLLGRTGAHSSDVAAAFREAIRLQPEFAEAHNNLGLVLIQSGDDEGGIAALREAVRIAPRYADALANLGAALTPTDAAAAIRELEKAVALAPGSVKGLFNLAVAYGASPEHGAVKEIEQLRKVIEVAPTFARARLALGKALLRKGDVPAAIVELEEASRLEPESGEAHYQLGLALSRAGRKEEAAVALRKGRELVSTGERSQTASLEIGEGRLALKRGELEEAARRFRQAAKLLPDAAEPQEYLGQALEQQGDVEGAAAAYRKAVERNPAAVTAKQRLERLTAAGAGVADRSRMAELEAYIRDRRYEEVEPLLEKYVEQHPDSSWGWYALGYSQFAQQKIGESIKSLSKSLQLDLANAEAHKILGRNLMIIGRFDAAQIEFEQGIRYRPDSAELYYNLGKLHSIQDNWGPAREALESAVRLDPSNVEALDALGFAREALGDDEGAVATYLKAIEVNGQQGGAFEGAHVNLAAYYNRTGNAAKALEYARQAIEVDPESDAAWFQRGRADEREGRLDDAVAALNRAIALNPRASSYYYVLAGVYRRMDWMDESRKALDVFKRLERESEELEKKRRAASRRRVPGQQRD